MKDPLALAAVTIAGTAATALTDVLGVPMVSLVFGLLGCFVGLVLMPAQPTARKRGLPFYLSLGCTVVANVACAGMFGDITGVVAQSLLGTVGVKLTDSQALRAGSFVWGAAAQPLLVALIELLRKKLGGAP